MTQSLPRASRAQGEFLVSRIRVFLGETVTRSLPGASCGVLYCVHSVFEDEDSERTPLKVWKHFEKVIGLTASEYVELDESQK